MKKYSDIYNDGQYELNNPSWNEPDAALKASWIVLMLKKHKLKPNSICEVGCGNGQILKTLRFELPEATLYGVDISQRAIEQANRNKEKECSFENADVLDLNFEFKHRYDLLLTIDLIEHLENYFEYLRKIQKSCTYAIFHIPLDMSMWTLFREKMLLESKDRVGHIHNFTEDFICSVLEDMDFEIMEKQFTLPNYKPNGAKAKIVFAIRNLLFKLNKRFCSKSVGGLSLLVLAKTRE